MSKSNFLSGTLTAWLDGNQIRVRFPRQEENESYLIKESQLEEKNALGHFRMLFINCQCLKEWFNRYPRRTEKESEGRSIAHFLSLNSLRSLCSNHPGNKGWIYGPRQVCRVTQKPLWNAFCVNCKFHEAFNAEILMSVRVLLTTDQSDRLIALHVS